MQNVLEVYFVTLLLLRWGQRCGGGGTLLGSFRQIGCFLPLFVNFLFLFLGGHVQYRQGNTHSFLSVTVALWAVYGADKERKKKYEVERQVWGLLSGSIQAFLLTAWMRLLFGARSSTIRGTHRHRHMRAQIETERGREREGKRGGERKRWSPR